MGGEMLCQRGGVRRTYLSGETGEQNQPVRQQVSTDILRHHTGAVVGCITLNFVMTTSSDQVTETAEQMKEFSTLQLHQDPRGTIINEMVQMAENLKDLDKKIEAYQGKDTLTRQDSLNLKSLLIQADALNALLNGRREQLNTDSANINK